MRMAIGLAGVLVTIGVVVWIMSAITLPSTKAALDAKKRVQPQVEQMAGHTANGTRAVDTVQVKGQSRGGKLSALVVTSVVEGAAMDKYFGLKRDDAIKEIGPLSVSDMDSPDAAKDFLVAEYQRSGQITVTRDGKDVKLPLPPEPKKSGEPAAPAAAGDNSLQQQLDAIQTPR
jgi:hypothetical protein